MTEQPDAGSGELSFDRAIPATPVSLGGSGSVTCANCKRTVTDSYHTANGEPVCDTCRALLGHAVSSVSDPVSIAKALVLGVGATCVGAFVYWAVIRFADLEIGLVAILSGWMIGKALRTGAGGRGGRALQVIGALLVYVSVAMAYFPFVYAGAAGEAPVLAVAIAALQLPLRAVFGSGSGGFISLLIIGFGMMQAWQQAKAPEVHFEGPFRVGGSAA